MVIGIGDTVTVTNTVGPSAEDGDALGVMSFYAKQQATRSEDLDLATMAYALLAVLQMGWYWDKVKDHVEDRDCAIGEWKKNDKGMLGFLFDLEAARDGLDWGILQEKAGIKNDITTELGIWKPNACSSATRYVGDLLDDVKTITKMEEMFADQSHEGIPDGWGTHDASLALGLGAAFSGPIMNMASVDIYEDFKQYAVSIVQKAQMSMKGIYNISSIMRYYEQVIQLHEGLADMYLQGFNSAGAMLGTAVGKLASAASGSGSSLTFNSSSVSGSSPTVHPAGMIGGVR